MRFPKQEYRSGLPFSSSGDLLNPGVEPGSPTLQADSSLSEPPGTLYITVFLRAKTLIKQAGGQTAHSGLLLPKQCIQTHVLLQCTKFVPYLHGIFLG